MDQTAFDRLAATFVAFHAEFAPLFGRREARIRSEQYLRSLLVQQTDRRNAENLAESVDGATPRSFQRFLTESPWPVDPVIGRLQAHLARRLNHDDGVWVLDESGFPKQGRKSVGVATQYCGRVGKVANCQVGVFLAYVSPRGHALVDGRLYLPQRWTDDPDRRRAVGVPDGVSFATKPELGLAMLREARARGHIHGQWVTGDELYGDSPDLRDALAADGLTYVLEVRPDTRVYCTADRDEPVGGEPAAGVAERLGASTWSPVTVGEGEHGPRTYCFAAQRVWECRRKGVRGPACWLLVRRTLESTEPRYYLSNAGAEMPMAMMAWVSGQRWPIETEFQVDKGETGLDEYEVRSWAGWHHHVTCVLLAGAFLVDLEQEWGEKNAGGNAAATDAGVAGNAAASGLDTCRAAALAPEHPGTQRGGEAQPSEALVACRVSRP